MSDDAPSAPPNLAPDALIFLVGGGLVFAVVRWGVPALAAAGMDPFAAWMLLSVPCVFLPILCLGAWLLRSGRPAQAWAARLWLRPLTRRAWRLTAGGLAAILVASALLGRLCVALGLSPDPFARAPQAWTANHVIRSSTR